MLHIVHLEDEKQLLEAMPLILEDLAPDAHIVQFADSDPMVAYIEEHGADVDLFILDIRVPGKLDGLGVAQFIRDRGLTSGIVVTSAFEPPPTAQLRGLNAHFERKTWELPASFERMLAAARR